MYKIAPFNAKTKNILFQNKGGSFHSQWCNISLVYDTTADKLMQKPRYIKIQYRRPYISWLVFKSESINHISSKGISHQLIQQGEAASSQLKHATWHGRHLLGTDHSNSLSMLSQMLFGWLMRRTSLRSLGSAFLSATSRKVLFIERVKCTIFCSKSHLYCFSHLHLSFELF